MICPLPNTGPSPCDVGFQVSLLHLLYPGSAVIPQVALLEQLRDAAATVSVPA